MPWTPPQIGAIEPPSDVTVLEYEVTEVEFVRACYEGLLGVKGSFSPFLTLFLLLCVIGLIANLVLGWVLAAYIAAGSTFAILAIWWIARSMLSTRFKRNFARVLVDSPITLAYGDRFIGTRTKRSIAGISRLYAVKKTTAMRLIYTAPNVYFFVPVRVFASNAEMDRFDRIVESLCTKQ